MSTDRLTLSQYKLATFLACQRRFQLRYLRRLPWPAAPLPEKSEQLLQQGQDFHQLLERHFLGFQISAATIPNAQVRRWWQAFESHSPVKELAGSARFLPETSLTVPLGRHLLIGRFDLLVLGKDADERPFAHIFDWKTGHPASEAELNSRWQTRLYLALLAEGGRAYWPEDEHPPPPQLRLTYWYGQAADAPITIGYSESAHQANWAELHQVTAQIDAAMADEHWPLTENWDHCRECVYQTYCGRQGAGTAVPELEESEDLAGPDALLLTPDLP